MTNSELVRLNELRDAAEEIPRSPTRGTPRPAR